MTSDTHRKEDLIRRLQELAPLVVAAILFSRHLFADLFGDEWGHTRSVVLADSFWGDLLAPEMSHPPLFFALARLAWSALHTEWSMRLPSLIAALATVWLAGLLADKIGGRRLAVTVRWLAACSPFLMDFATEARPYALLILFATGSVWAFLRLLDGEDRRSAALFAFMSTAGILTHYFFGLLFGFLVLWYTCRRNRFTRSAAIAFLPPLLVVALLGVLLFVVQGGAATGIVQVDPARDRLQAPNFLARLAVALNYGYCTFWLPPLDFARNVPSGVVMRNMPQFAMLGIAGTGFVAAFWSLCRKRTTHLSFLSFGIALPTAVAVTAGVLGAFLLREKYLAVVWPFVLVLAAMALMNLTATRWGRVAVAAHLALITVSAVHFLVYPNVYSRRMDWTGLRATIESAGRSDVVLAYLDDARTRPESHNTSGTRVSFGCLAVKDSLRRGETLADFAQRLHAGTIGPIFLISNETDRHSEDPNGILPKALASLRSQTIKPFGRNLLLYTFESPINVEH